MNDSLLIVPPYAESAPDTVLNADFDAALSAHVFTPLEPVAEVVEVPAWQSGLEGSPRLTELGDNSGILAIIAGVAVLMLLSYGKFRRLFSTLTANLWSLRTRANAFDDHTSNETPVLILLAAQWSLYTGLLLFTATDPGEPRSPGSTFCTCISVAGVMAAYYVAQVVIYYILGYTFTSAHRRALLVSGFTSSQSLLGCLLMPMALVAIFYSEAAGAMLILAFICYVLARIVFNIKGFRIFYHNFSSLLYYILYLCTLEIIPLLIIYRIVKHLVAE